MILTGESADVSKKETVSNSEASAKLTNVNMVYSSTSLVEGKLKAELMYKIDHPLVSFLREYVLVY